MFGLKVLKAIHLWYFHDDLSEEQVIKAVQDWSKLPHAVLLEWSSILHVGKVEVSHELTKVAQTYLDVSIHFLVLGGMARERAVIIVHVIYSDCSIQKIYPYYEYKWRVMKLTR